MPRKITIGKPQYQRIIDLEDEKINVLLLGTSGCGKSTLINSILGEEKAKTGTGQAVTKDISVYEDPDIPFRMIDTVGYEYGFFKQNKIKNDFVKLSKEGVKKNEINKLIHMIWFCIDGTVKRIDQVVLDYIKSITNDWKNVPIIIVFTKSYSDIEIQENIEMANKAIITYNATHRKQMDVRDIIPVVAKTYQINENVSVPPKGLDVLVTRTNELAPEAKRLAESTIKEIDLKLKRNTVNSYVSTGTIAAATVGAVPVSIPDATILVPMQTFMMRGIAKTYGITEESNTNKIIDQIIKIGGTTIAGKALINLLKNIPGFNVAASVINAVVAGVITFAAGEVSAVVFEKMYTGEIDSAGVDWEKEITALFAQYIPDAVSIINDLLKQNNGEFSLSKFLDALFIKKDTNKDSEQ